LETRNLRIAIYYDWLNQWGGAERVLLEILKIFPKSPVFTLIYNPKKTNWLPAKTQVFPSTINKLSISKKNNILQTPFYAIAAEQFDFSQFDIVISTTQISGHCLLTSPRTLFICYFHNINRYVYQTPKRFKFLSPLLNIYKKTDYIYSQRPDYLLCNSNTVRDRILKNYHRPSTVIYPGVDTDFFTPSNLNSTSDYFLVVSRLVSHKKIDIAMKACSFLKKKLIIVGTGREKSKLENLKNKLNDQNIIFMGRVSDKKLKLLYQNCLALICPQVEDYGLTPLEAQSCGRPVIAYNKGGITETIIPNKTGLFFKHQTVKSLTLALKMFRPESFSSESCVANAKKFSKENFVLNFKQTIKLLWKEYINAQN
jgi:glycosyltransferase involved in cell wall biosynthesis